MQIQSTRLWIVLLLVITESCLVPVLVSMEGVTVNSTSIANDTRPDPRVVNLCWSWGAAAGRADCPMDMLFSEIVIAAIALLFCLLPAVLHCLKERSVVYHSACLCPGGCEVLCFFMPLFFSISAFLLGIVFLGIILEDNRHHIFLTDHVNLSQEMIYEKPWRVGLASFSCLLALMAVIFSGILAGKWRKSGDEEPGHVQSRPLLRTRNERSTLKSSLFVTDL